MSIWGQGLLTGRGSREDGHTLRLHFLWVGGSEITNSRSLSPVPREDPSSERRQESWGWGRKPRKGLQRQL